MAPKNYVGCFNYEDRWLQNYFLDLLPNSKEGREANEQWRALTGEVHLGLKDRYDEVANTNMPIKGL